MELMVWDRRGCYRHIGVPPVGEAVEDIRPVEGLVEDSPLELVDSLEVDTLLVADSLETVADSLGVDNLLVVDTHRNRAAHTEEDNPGEDSLLAEGNRANRLGEDIEDSRFAVDKLVDILVPHQGPRH